MWEKSSWEAAAAAVFDLFNGSWCGIFLWQQHRCHHACIQATCLWVDTVCQQETMASCPLALGVFQTPSFHWFFILTSALTVFLFFFPAALKKCPEWYCIATAPSNLSHWHCCECPAPPPPPPHQNSRPPLSHQRWLHLKKYMQRAWNLLDQMLAKMMWTRDSSDLPLK